MNRFTPALSAVISMFFVSLSMSQEASAPPALPAARVSPADIASAVVDGNRVMVVYSRPFSKLPGTEETRKIWGGLVPYGKVWRLGANEATLLITQQPLVLGGVNLPAGAYTLFMLPQETGPSKLIINKQIGQAGDEYDEKEDLARVNMEKTELGHPVHQLTIAVTPIPTPNPTGGGMLTVTWENTQFAVPFTLKR